MAAVRLVQGEPVSMGGEVAGVACHLMKSASCKAVNAHEAVGFGGVLVGVVHWVAKLWDHAAAMVFSSLYWSRRGGWPLMSSDGG